MTASLISAGMQACQNVLKPANGTDASDVCAAIAIALPESLRGMDLHLIVNALPK